MPCASPAVNLRTPIERRVITVRSERPGCQVFLTRTWRWCTSTLSRAHFPSVRIDPPYPLLFLSSISRMVQIRQFARKTCRMMQLVLVRTEAFGSNSVSEPKASWDYDENSGSVETL